MRFLIDANLPPSLAAWLTAEGFEARHTFDIELASATDRQIWGYAKDHDFIIITRDEDFILLNTVEPEGPRVVWVRIGNAIKRTLLARFEVAWPAVVKSLLIGETVVELR